MIQKSITEEFVAEGVLEQDTFDPDDETMTVTEMDDVCRDLLASTQAYQQGEVPMRETIYADGKPVTYWRFTNGLAADLYTIVLARHHASVLFTATVSELPGCAASGLSQFEALVNARKAIDDWIDTAVKDGRDIPTPPKRPMRLITVNAA